MIPELSSERAKILSKALIESSTSLNGLSSRSFLSLNTSRFANVVALDLIDVVNSEERYSFLSELLQNAEIFSIAALADIINMVELAYGRLGAEGRLHNYTKPITLDELIQIESVFTNRVKELLQEHEMFDFMDWQIVFYLLECYDSEYAKSYLTKAFVDDANIVKYLECSVGIWIGGLTKYEIKEEYKKYLTVDQILKAIQSTRDSGSLFAMPEKIQNICGAFFLWATEENSSPDEISQITVNQLLDTWKKQYFAK